MIPTYSVLAHLRHGSTIVSQAIALYLSKKYSTQYKREYQGEITNIYKHLMYYDEEGNDCIYDDFDTPPNGSYNKTYRIIYDQVARVMDYNNLAILKQDSPEREQEILKRITCMNHNQNAEVKCVYKIQTSTFADEFEQHIGNAINKHSFIFCTRNFTDQFISWVTAKTTKIYHRIPPRIINPKLAKGKKVKPVEVDLTEPIIEVPKINVSDTMFNEFVRHTKNTIKIFETYRKQIVKVIDYDSWQGSPTKIYEQLEWDDYKEHVTSDELNEHLLKKLIYSTTPKKYIENYNQVLEWIDNEPTFRHKF